MYLIALKMLWGDKSKYFGLIFGIMFATLLMAQQVSIFIGIISRTANQINDVYEANIWVMHPEIQYVDQIKPIPDKQLLRVRSVSGVKWAVPLYKGLGIARALGGIMHQVMIIGVDDTTLTGRPPSMFMGKWEDLKLPDSVIIDKAGYKFLWPNDPITLGRTLEINDRRVTIVAVCNASATFFTFPVMYTRYSKALDLSPGERNRMSFVIAKTDRNPIDVANEIHDATGMQALTTKQFAQRSISYYLKRTGIPINFGLTVLLGFIIGVAVAGQTFYIFVIENIRRFATLKAIGVTNNQILQMVLLQALVVAFIGYSIGIGLCALFFTFAKNFSAFKGITLLWQVMLGTAIAVLLIVLFASIASIRRIFVLDPAILFRE